MNINYGKCGLMYISLHQDETRENSDKLIETEHGKIWICDFKTYEENTSSLFIDGEARLPVGFPRSYVLRSNGDTVQNVEWSVENEHIDKITDGEKITLTVQNDTLLGEKFRLYALSNGETAEKTITITDIWRK